MECPNSFSSESTVATGMDNSLREDAIFATLHLPETLDAYTRSIRRNRGDSNRPEDFLSDSGPIQQDSWQAPPPLASSIRFRRMSDLRPTGFLGGSGEFSFSPAMRTSERWAGSNSSDNESCHNLHPSDSSLQYPTGMALKKSNNINQDNVDGSTKFTAVTMDSSAGSSLVSQDEDGCIDERAVRVFKEALNDSVASLKIAEEKPSRYFSESSKEDKLDKPDPDSSKTKKKAERKKSVSHTPKPHGAKCLPKNTPRQRCGGCSATRSRNKSYSTSVKIVPVLE